ncbi:MAG: hypothetical protein Fur0022_32000 [Anaerolineales bacterium]
MFLKMIHTFRNKRWLTSVLLLLFLLLTACAQSRVPLEITEATVSPEPLIGQIATLHIEFVAPTDESLTTLEIFLPEGVKLVKGDLTWKGSLIANQPQTHDISICTEFQGNYWISIVARLWEAEDDFKFIAPETVVLDITQTDAQVVTSKNYSDLVRPTSTFGPAILPTALPGDWVSPCP